MSIGKGNGSTDIVPNKDHKCNTWSLWEYGQLPREIKDNVLKEKFENDYNL